ncbi:PBP1A family penicillin-binding protein [Sphingomonas lacunae]|uniref:PBP1A family penicillin-binding protein n=1 Tax=Sphingomonas lacunae TaxID=2698828 RepID=A0A6M4ART0_9SPHN|nr:PBP1A family penicillin-binding protein [Sphingomonas lacunae]QJQ31765.1 PBP1A family penicillin-binding protein [Sphingomonas lacunae]
MRDDDFDLPEGYGGTGAGNEDAAARRARLAQLEAEVAASSARDATVGQHAPVPPFSTTISREPVPPSRWPWTRRWKWIGRGSLGLAILLMLTIGWLAITAPLSKSLQPIAPPQLTLVSADGRPIARNGAIVDRPVDVTRLPPHVIHAFLATEDRRFYDHWGVDPRGIARAFWTNLTTGQRHGGSTITQQLAKFTFLTADQTYTRKAREMLIAWWMEAWLTKDEILSRYLSNAYFGDNVYGLRAASLHYFYRQPERLTLTQAAMLAGLVKAPSRLAPTRNLRAAQEREKVVLAAMVEAGYLTEAERRAVRLARTDTRARSSLPTGTYFADWAMPQARATVQSGYGEAQVTTTLDARLQDIARRVTARGDLGRAQVALVAMRPNGEVVAMIGGRNYRDSPFNRATQARRQPGSTFKLVVYYAALRAGMTPETMVDDSPITNGTYRPANSGERYRGMITLREAFARSSNVAAVRLYHQLGSDAVNDAARDLGVASPLAENASVALGSSGVTLIELTAAYAAFAGGERPVEPHALRREEQGFFERLFDGRSAIASDEREAMRSMLRAVVEEGTGRRARLAIPAYGKTGTSQDNRDALFIGFAAELVVGVWIGNDDNSPLRRINGGGLPAQIWQDFMSRAIPGAAPRRSPDPRPEPETPQIFDDLPIAIGEPQLTIDPESGVAVDTRIGEMGITIDRNGVSIRPGGGNEPQVRPPPGSAGPVNGSGESRQR